MVSFLPCLVVFFFRCHPSVFTAVDNGDVCDTIRCMDGTCRRVIIAVGNNRNVFNERWYFWTEWVHETRLCAPPSDVLVSGSILIFHKWFLLIQLSTMVASLP